MAKPSVLVSARLRELVKEANQNGLKWKDIKAPSAATMTKVVNDHTYRMSDNTAKALDEVLGWEEGTARAIALGELRDPAYRRVEVPEPDVSGMGKVVPIANGGGRGKGIMQDERDMIVRQLAEVGGSLAAVAQQLLDLAQTIKRNGE